MEATMKKSNVGNNLSEGPILKGLVLFAIPIVLANLIQQLYGMVDLMVIGQYVGNVGTVGVSTGGEISDMILPIATAFGTAGQIYIAQLVGAKSEDKIKSAGGTLISLTLLMSLVLMIGTMVFSVQILNLLNCPEEAFAEARRYMLITAVGMPFIFGYNSICGILRGMGESKKPMLFIIIAAITNIVLDVVLVVIFDLDVVGTAVATVFSQVASCVAAFIYMYMRREAFGFELKLSYFKMDRQSLKIIFNLGVPQAVRSTLVRFSMLWVNSCVNSYGLVYSSTNSIGNKLQKFLEVYTLGFSQAAAAMVGQNLGAKRNDRARKTVWYTLGINLVLATIVALLIILVPRGIFGIFTTDPEVLEVGVIYLRIMIIHFYMSGIVGSFQSMVIGCGNASLNFAIGILDGVICKVGLSALFAYALGMGAMGFFWGTAVSRALPSLICAIYFLSNRWEKRKLLTE